jgi:hypothetical protein
MSTPDSLGSKDLPIPYKRIKQDPVADEIGFTLRKSESKMGNELMKTCNLSPLENPIYFKHPSEPLELDIDTDRHKLSEEDLAAM